MLELYSTFCATIGGFDISRKCPDESLRSTFRDFSLNIFSPAKMKKGFQTTVLRLFLIIQDQTEFLYSILIRLPFLVSAVSEDAGIEPRTVAEFAYTVTELVKPGLLCVVSRSPEETSRT